MTSHFLVGFFNLLIAAAVTISRHGRRSDHNVPSCASADCSFEAFTNQSGVADGGTLCECCWQDCERISDDVQLAELLHLHVLNDTRAMMRDTPATADVDAWLIMSDGQRHWGSLEMNMYTPILETVKVGVEAYGAVTRLISAEDLGVMMGEIIDGIRAAVARGRRPFVFSVGHRFAVDPQHLGFHIARIRRARDAGAYIVAYQTEPLFNWANITKEASLAIAIAQYMGAHEVWDYSLAHTQNYPPHDFIVRYVPPGYVSKLDVGVDVSSSLADLGSIGYMGSSSKQMHAKYKEMFAEHLHVSNTIHTNDELRTFLETYPLQLNQHRFQSCCPQLVKWESGHQHFETFRMASLLANKACVISALSSEEDMRMFKNIVTFVEIDETMSTMKRLAGNLSECRMRSYEAYKQEFAPSKLLQASGFFDVWSPPRGK